ncbi:Virulence protein, SciE type [Candidatus Sulfopaludibacter sp. SbA3]|nr:Virulence protein, SciE type [Candidatus Sulfopaludibacter sp. SbA3]
MNARELYHAGQLGPAIQALGAELRDNPTDTKRRTFLFELLCFAGEYDRAQKHLDVLAGQGPDAATGALLYLAALNADRMRSDLFIKRDYPEVHESAPVSGTLNGKPFESIEDADPRIGPRLEIFAAGQVMWLPLAHVASLTMEAPKRLRDLLWSPALLHTGPAFKGTELGEVLLPVLSPLSFQHKDDAVRLGRSTVWEEQENGDIIPFGQKMLLVDGEDFPLLELRNLEITAAVAAPEKHASA